MKRVMGLAIAVGIAVLLLGACSDENVRPGPEPAVTEESDLIALYLAGELRPPAEMSSRVYADLDYIRSTFVAEQAALDTLPFQPPWRPSKIYVWFDGETAQMVAHDEYNAWDQLNASLGISDIDNAGSGDLAFTLTFDGLLHPRRLAELYGDLPGVDSTFISGYLNGGPNVYPRLADGEITYLFVHTACRYCIEPIALRYWYFTPDGERYVLAGVRDKSQWTPEPEWWDEAMLNRWQFWDL